MPLHYWKWAPKSIWRCRIRWWHLFVTKIAYSALKIDFPLGAVSVPPLKVWSVKYTLVTWPNLKGCRSLCFVERCYRSIYQVNTSYRCWDLEGGFRGGWFGPNLPGLAQACPRQLATGRVGQNIRRQILVTGPRPYPLLCLVFKLFRIS